jgi:hypothetical protein
MESSYATEVQLNSEVIVSGDHREEIVAALADVCVRAGEGFLHAIKVGPDRIIVEAKWAEMEDAAMTICPERLAAHEFTFVDLTQ